MKICIIAPNFKEPTAWMISAYKTAVNLAKIKDVKVIVLTSQTKGSKKFEIIEGVKVYRSKAIYIPDPFNYAFTPFIFSDLRRLIKKENPDRFLISKYMFFSSLTAFQLKLLGKKFVIQTDTFPGYIWFAPSRLLNIFMWIYTRTLGLWVLHLADKVILLYEGLVRPAKRLGLKKISVVHNGVDFDKFEKAKPAKDIVKFKDGKKLITYLGRLDEVKGYKLALKLANDLKDKAKFLFVCGNKYSTKRKELAIKYPFIKFVGFRKDVAEIFAASDIHILPSYNEGLPNSVMEAMASGCAVVASDVGGMRSIISDKKEGFLFKRGDYSKFKDLVEKLISDSQVLKTIKSSGKEKIKKEFNWKTIGESLLKEI